MSDPSVPPAAAPETGDPAYAAPPQTSAASGPAHGQPAYAAAPPDPSAAGAVHGQPAYAAPPAAPAPAPAAAAPPQNDPRRRSPLLATLLSGMPGLGQVYVGYYQRGFVHALVVATLIALFDAPAGLRPAEPLIGIFLAFFWLYNMIDAGRRALFYNEALAGRGDVELPTEFTGPGLRGSMIGGLVLIAIGLVFLSNTLFGLSLAWLEDWWPAALVAFGAYLVWRALQEKAAAPAD